VSASQVKCFLSPSPPWDKAVGAGTAGTAGAVPLFQDNNVIVFILQNLLHATHDSEAGEHIPRLLVY